MTDFFIDMGLAVLFRVTKEKDVKLLAKLKPALLKLRNAINLCYPSE